MDRQSTLLLGLTLATAAALATVAASVRLPVVRDCRATRDAWAAEHHHEAHPEEQVLARIDLRERRERFEPRRLEISPSVSDTVREIHARVRAEGDDALLDFTLRFHGADLREYGLAVSSEEFADARAVEVRARDRGTRP